MEDKPHYTAQQIKDVKAKAREQIAMLEGTGKHNHPGNFLYADGIFARSLLHEYGAESISALKKWARS